MYILNKFQVSFAAFVFFMWNKNLYGTYIKIEYTTTSI